MYLGSEISDFLHAFRFAQEFYHSRTYETHFSRGTQTITATTTPTTTTRTATRATTTAQTTRTEIRTMTRTTTTLTKKEQHKQKQ